MTRKPFEPLSDKTFCPHGPGHVGEGKCSYECLAESFACEANAAIAQDKEFHAEMLADDARVISSLMNLREINRTENEALKVNLGVARKALITECWCVPEMKPSMCDACEALQTIQGEKP